MKKFLKDLLAGLATMVLIFVLMVGGIWLVFDDLFPPVEVVVSPDDKVLRVRVLDLETQEWVSKSPAWLETYKGPRAYILGPSLAQLAGAE